MARRRKYYLVKKIDPFLGWPKKGHVLYDFSTVGLDDNHIICCERPRDGKSLLKSCPNPIRLATKDEIEFYKHSIELKRRLNAI